MAARTFPSTSVPRHQPKLRQPSLSSTRTPPMATRSQRHRGLPCTTSPLRPDVVANCWIRSLPCLASRAPRSILPSSPASPVRNPGAPRCICKSQPGFFGFILVRNLQMRTRVIVDMPSTPI